MGQKNHPSLSENFSPRLQLGKITFIILSLILSFSFLGLLGLIQWPNFGKYFLEELSPLGWFHSLLLFTSTGIAALIALLQFSKSKNNLEIKFWILFGAAFLYLCMDERFALHERLRDHLFKPLGIVLPPFFWTEPGNFVLLVFLTLALIFLFYFLRKISFTKLQLSFLTFAVFFAIIAIGLDSYPFESLGKPTLVIEQIIEESCETLSMLGFIWFSLESLLLEVF